MKKEDKILIGTTVGLFLLTLVIALVLRARKQQDEKAILDEVSDFPSPNTGGKGTTDNPTPYVPIAQANRDIVFSIQKAVNKIIDFYKSVNYQGQLPAKLVTDGKFGEKTKAAVNFLAKTFLDMDNASSKSLDELQAALAKKGLPTIEILKLPA